MSGCAKCGRTPAGNIRTYRDLKLTDHSVLVRERYERLCDDCARNFCDEPVEEPQHGNK